MCDIVGYDSSHLALECFATGCLRESINKGLLKLIPNNYNKDIIGGW